MHQNLEEYIYMKYPLLFNKREIVEGKPYYPIALGIDCNDGWFYIINNLCNSIYQYCQNYKIKFPDVIQIKEKFGTLRFYIDNGDTTIHQLINYAEMMTEKTCEMCGNVGRLRSDNRYVQTLCEEHYVSKDKELKISDFEYKINMSIPIHNGTEVLTGKFVDIENLEVFIIDDYSNKYEKETKIKIEHKKHPIFSYFILKQ